jgi:hypothetical protein
MFLSVKRSSYIARLHIDWDYPNFAQSTDIIVGVCQVKFVFSQVKEEIQSYGILDEFPI